MREKPRVLVVGSLNMDLVANTPRLPLPGETVMGTSFATIAGGKGANQAVAAAKLEAEVSMLGCVGDDSFGQRLISELQAVGIATSGVKSIAEKSSGIALINVDTEGCNSITVVPGANNQLTTEQLEANAVMFDHADVLVTQLEVPLAAIVRAVEMASERNVPVILNPAPACPLPDHLLAMVDILIPNETEAALLTGMNIQGIEDARKAANLLRQRGVKTVIITLGEKGALVSCADIETLVPAHVVRAVDTTAAGDAYTGALGVAIGRGQSLVEAANFAGMVAALSVTRSGAQPSLPTLLDVRKFAAGLKIGGLSK